MNTHTAARTLSTLKLAHRPRRRSLPVWLPCHANSPRPSCLWQEAITHLQDLAGQPELLAICPVYHLRAICIDVLSLSLFRAAVPE